jgi:transcriptional regulator with XRE-family HTH domain
MQLSELGPVLKEARKAANLGQEQLAAPLGVSRATISALESARCQEIGFSKLAALLNAVGLELTVRPHRSRPHYVFQTNGDPVRYLPPDRRGMLGTRPPSFRPT